MASCKTEGSADAGIVFHNYKGDYDWFSISQSSINHSCQAYVAHGGLVLERIMASQRWFFTKMVICKVMPASLHEHLSSLGMVISKHFLSKSFVTHCDVCYVPCS